MDGSFPSNAPPHGMGGGGFEVGGGAPQRRGFRGNEQNAKTKICMRCETAHALGALDAGVLMSAVSARMWQRRRRCHHCTFGD